VPVGVKTKCLALNADFSGVSGAAASWSATMKTPLLDITNNEASLAKLNLSFDLATSRMAPVTVRIESFNTANVSTGFCEASILPVIVNTLYRYSLDLSTMTAGATAFQPTGTAGDKIQISFSIAGTSADAQSWPRGTGSVNNQVLVDNVTYTAPSFYVSQDGGGTGLTEAAPAKVTDIIKIARPGDVICINPGTIFSTIEIDRINGTPSRWITIRSTYAKNPAVIRSNTWSAVKVFASASYINIQGIIVRGFLNDSDKIEAGLTLANATVDGEKINKVPGHEADPGYAIFADDPFGRAANLYYGDGKFNVNGIQLEGGDKKVMSGSDYVTVATSLHEGVHHIRIADCVVTENTGSGLGVTKGDYIIFENNVVSDNNHYNRSGGSGIGTLSAYNFDGGTGYKIIMNGNICHNNGGWVRWGPRIVTSSTGLKVITLNFSDGNGIIVDSHLEFGYLGRTLIQNNLSSENGGSGIHVYNSEHVDIVNNTAIYNNKANAAPVSVLSRRWVQQGALKNTVPSATYVNSPLNWYINGGQSHPYGQIYTQANKGTPSDISVRNNIVWTRAGQLILLPVSGISNVAYDYNLFGRDGGNAAAVTDSTGIASFTHNIIEASGDVTKVFVNATDPSNTATWLHLRTAAPVSPAINAGNLNAPGAPRDDQRGMRRPLGSAADIGAFEDL